LLPSLLGVAAVIAGLAYATSTSGRSTASAYGGPIPLPSPHSIVRNGHTYVVGKSPVVGASIHADPRVVTFYLESTGPSDDPPCDSLSPRLEVVGEDASNVAVAGFSYRGFTTAKAIMCSYSWSCSHPGYASITVRLAEPLGARTIVDADGGSHVGVLGGQRLPRVGYVPAGYRAEGDDDDEPLPGGVDAHRLGPPCVMYLQRSFANRAGRFFDVSVSSASAEPVAGRVTTRVDVDGHRADVRISRYERCVVWERPAGLQWRVCTSARKALPTPELIKVAQGLR